MKTKAVLFLSLALFLSFGPVNSDLKAYWKVLLNSAQIEEDKQSFCFEENEQILGENIDLRIKPASVTKLYTTLWSLDSLGKDFRFQTKFMVKNNDLYIIGGSDPFFVTENIFVIMDYLNRKGLKDFETVYFSEDFYLNWSDSPEQISSLLMKLLNLTSWDSTIKETFTQVNLYLKRQQLGTQLEVSSFKVKKALLIKNMPINSEEFSFIYRSSPIWQHLKQVNMFSNNFYSDKIFNFLGGSIEFSDYIYKKISATDNEIYFYSGSGLGNNFTTCRVTLKMLHALEEVVRNQGISISDVVAIPGVDDGTLKNRFEESQFLGKLAAKTGTLRDTSSLAGYLFQEETIKFGVFNSTFNREFARKIQDKLVKQAIKNYGQVTSINYAPGDYISIKDSEIIE